MVQGVSITKKPFLTPHIDSFKIKINGKEHIFSNNDHVKLINGDRFEIVGQRSLETLFSKQKWDCLSGGSYLQ
jgi:hypothetical protein